MNIKFVLALAIVTLLFGGVITTAILMEQSSAKELQDLQSNLLLIDRKVKENTQLIKQTQVTTQNAANQAILQEQLAQLAAYEAKQPTTVVQNSTTAVVQPPQTVTPKPVIRRTRAS